MKNVTKLTMYVAHIDGVYVSEQVGHAVNYSDNFTSGCKLLAIEQDAPLEEVGLDDNGEDIFIECPHCQHTEQQPVDQQRHHLGTFNIMKWLDEIDDVERSLMECCGCSGNFIQAWDYKKDEDLEEVEWSYACTSSVISGAFDYGEVWAKTREEAIDKAREEISTKVKEINNRLEGLSYIEVNLDCLEVTREDD
jgi:hypothetical protein